MEIYYFRSNLGKDHLGAEPLQPARITKWSAEGHVSRGLSCEIRFGSDRWYPKSG